MYARILKNISRFIELNETEIAYFTSLLQERKVSKKEFLTKEGEICRHTYFVNKGCLRTFYSDKEGGEHNVSLAIEDWWAGDLYGQLTGKPARFNVIALEASELLAIEKKSQEELYFKVPKFERFFRILTQNAYVASQERILASMTETAEERYLHFRKKNPEMDKRIAQHHIASYLGIKPESLSRIRKNLARKNKTN
jgi:CRP-like cAMP-binding protein